MTEKEGYLLTLTDEQLEEIQNDGLAEIGTDEELFHIVHHDHGAEAVETIEDQDVEVVRRSVEKRE